MGELYARGSYGRRGQARPPSQGRRRSGGRWPTAPILPSGWPLVCRSLRLSNCLQDSSEPLPESVASLSALQLLDVSGNCLTTLPEALSRLSALQLLDVSRNKLSAPLAGGLSALRSLRCVDLSHNWCGWDCQQRAPLAAPCLQAACQRACELGMGSPKP